ncbi:hypothetical protein RIF29_21273 [Crotalaria pallida]|uniref:Uncharacterized protein n=1 Tax=Crotalaria pallida TaxID=3830 RepID=A0AAN9F2Q4_CROPI
MLSCKERERGEEKATADIAATTTDTTTATDTATATTIAIANFHRTQPNILIAARVSVFTLVFRGRYRVLVFVSVPPLQGRRGGGSRVVAARI